MIENIEVGMTLPEGTFNKASFIELLKTPSNPKLLAGEDRILIREEIKISPYKLYLAALHRPMSEEDRQAAIATLNASRRYLIEDIDDSVKNRTRLDVEDEVLLDWSSAVNMIRVDTHSESPNMIETAAAIGSLKFAESKGLTNMPDITIIEYIMVWSRSIIGIYNGERINKVFGKVDITKAAPKQKFLKPDISRF